MGYEVYIRSFADGNGDGIGDFAGLHDKLDHLAWLGVDVVWITPFYPSPMVDFGYDVADFTDVDPMFGTLEDLGRVVSRAHELGIRIIVDLVPNHTSDQHEWFRASKSSITDPKRDWYLWRDPAPDGGPPNNWVTHFGGSAWTLDEASGQYYCHLFLPEQPDLNWAHPAVQHAFEDILIFWLERGVDGFRIDVTQGLVKDSEFRDNPEIYPLSPGMDRIQQWDSMEHLHDIRQAETLEIFRRWREVCEPYNAFLLGETYLLDPLDLRHFLEPNDGIHTGFWFAPMHMDWSANEVRRVINGPLDAVGGSVGWAMSSHDDPRAPGRFGDKQTGPLRALGLFAMFCGLPGTPFLYQGDELGLADGVVPPEFRQDPVGQQSGVETDHRDGCRTPVPWAPGVSFGFSSSPVTWLPDGGRVNEDTVAHQREDPGSILNRMRQLLAVRRANLADRDEPFEWVTDLPNDVVGYRRGDLYYVINCGGDELSVPLVGDAERLWSSTGSAGGAGDAARLAPNETVIARGFA